MATPESVNIILVEDDDGHATLVERNLRRAGLANGFLRLKDGQEALDHFRGPDACPPGSEPGACVVLLDIKMPRVDGIEVLRQLKADPRTAPLPVIMLTTTDDPREIDRCYQLGCNVYITKPVEYDAFIEAIRRLGFFLQVVKLPPNGKGKNG
jgi:CheY-like chemotaxis protein